MLLSRDCAFVLYRTVLSCNSCHFLSKRILSGLGKKTFWVTWIAEISKCLACICGHVILSKVGVKRKDKRQGINLRNKKFPIKKKEEREA